MKKQFYVSYYDENNSNAVTVRVPAKVRNLGDPIQRKDGKGFYHLVGVIATQEDGVEVPATAILNSKYQEKANFKEGDVVDMYVTEKGASISAAGERVSIGMFATSGVHTAAEQPAQGIPEQV